MKTIYKPWGTFENLLDTEYCKVKEIVIKRVTYWLHEICKTTKI